MIIPVTDADIDTLIRKKPYYAPAVISGGQYPGVSKPVKTFGVLATVVASTKTSEDSVYALVKALFDNLAIFKRMHPAFANLKKENMITQGLTAPLHKGAIRYYKEKGWLK